jgi:hypothetical protein
MPSIPGLPLLALTRRKTCWQFSRPQTSSISCSSPAGLSVSHFAVNDSVPSRRALGASLLPSPVRPAPSGAGFSAASRSSSPASYSPLLTVRPSTSWPTMPAADSRGTIKMDCSTQSRCRSMRRGSRCKFDRLPRTTTGFTTSALVELGFAVICKRAPRRRPR